MGTDNRLSWGGRYGPDSRREDMDWHGRRSRFVEKDYDGRRADDRHRDSPEFQPDSDATSDYVTHPEGFLQQSQSHHVVRTADAEQQPASVCTESLLKPPAASSVATTASASPTVNTSAVPDMSTYQYDKASGYYYDPKTCLYYDPSSQYYYNSETQQYLYWDSEEQTYVTATADMMAEQSSSSKEPKGKKKPNTKSAEQIAKNMERWTKRLNKKKGLGPSKKEDKKWSAANDAGPALSEKKSDPFVSYNGNSDPWEGGMNRTAEEEGNITDWRTMLCQRQFPTQEAPLHHQQPSDLHKATMLKYRDRAAERREKSGVQAAKEFYQPPAHYDQPTRDGLTSNNIGNKMFQAMGWYEGKGLERHQQDITNPFPASLRGTRGTSFGIQPHEFSPYDSYEDPAHEAVFTRFPEFE